MTDENTAAERPADGTEAPPAAEKPTLSPSDNIIEQVTVLLRQLQEENSKLGADERRAFVFAYQQECNIHDVVATALVSDGSLNEFAKIFAALSAPDSSVAPAVFKGVFDIIGVKLVSLLCPPDVGGIIGSILQDIIKKKAAEAAAKK